MGRLFGTDGARGIANTELTCEMAMNIGRAAAIVLTKHTNHKPKIVIGMDTRISSEMLLSALVAGICSVGANAEILGVIPTPAVAYLVKKYSADAGVMISASHNPVEFNGIKLFSNTGYKLSDEIENEIESLILDTPEKIELKSGEDLGKIFYSENAVSDYINHIYKALEGDLKGLKVAIDCANGSSSATAEKLFEKTGAELILINNTPNGININKNCGSTHLDALKETVVTNKCDIGLAFDGDADRCLAVDENGNEIDGDQMIGICAKELKNQGKLYKDTAVVTVMSNIGFFKFCEKNGINIAVTKVGDRYVLEEMLQKGYVIGGEQSGHIIFSDFASTGDGELSGLMLLQILKKSGLKASDLAKSVEKFPQILINVKVSNINNKQLTSNPKILDAIETCTNALGNDGRILVRPSGTEPLVRVMVEGKNQEEISVLANQVADIIKEQLS